MRIEVYEKYEFYDRDEPDWETMGVARPKNPPQYSYRRTYLDAFQIERPIEIPGVKNEFVLRLISGEDMICLGDFDQFCITLHDIEEQIRIEDELMMYEIGEYADQKNGNEG